PHPCHDPDTRCQYYLTYPGSVSVDIDPVGPTPVMILIPDVNTILPIRARCCVKNLVQYNPVAPTPVIILIPDVNTILPIRALCRLRLIR
ncbi:hypothetical protein RRG08_058989, partial [Elysia crispata]